LAKSPDADRPEIERALLAHLCRCTGWQPIVDAAVAVRSATPPRQDRDLVAATARATLESHGPQAVSPAVTLGAGGFADDAPPSGALVAVLNDLGDWIVGETLAEARTAAGTVQGRRTTDTGGPPLDLPAGDWAVTLRTSWVEPAPLEVDASWCIPGGTPASPLANGGAFGAKVASEAPLVARRLADEHNRPVRVVLRREDMVRRGPKRPPVAGGVRADGTGILRVVRTAGISAAIAAVAPHLVIEEVDVAGPPTSTSIRAAGWAEALVLTRAVGDQTSPVIAPGGGTAQVSIEADGTVVVRVDAGEVLDAAVLDSYVVGAVHQALSWVTSEALTVAPDGLIGDLTIRSFGILRAVDMPAVRIEHVPSTRPAVAVGDAVFVATASAIWQRQGRPEVWPTTIASRSSD
jgi:xanthine dehydrogenase small subunit